MLTTNSQICATSKRARCAGPRPPDTPSLIAPASTRKPADTHIEPEPHTLQRASDEDLANTKRELINRNLALERANEDKAQLLAMAAHDLGNPISNILITSELLLEETGQELTAEHRDLLTAIHSSGEYMQRLLDSIFRISALESDLFRLSFEFQNPHEVLKRAVSGSGPFASSRQARMVLQAEEPIPKINLDPGKLEWVFNNLIDNAIKYSQPGARVEVTISAQSDGLLVSVCDNGPGIPPEDFEKLFTPFQKTRARMIQHGSGLGLAIAKRIVTRHGGQIWAESKVGSGSTFYVRLPISHDQVESEDRS
jgi:two-component system, sensor histidine kinase and response regulator